jgi:hypothetical protein
VQVTALACGFYRDNVECDGYDEMGEELVDFDEDQHGLSEEAIRCDDVDSLEVGAGEVVVPVEAET